MAEEFSDLNSDGQHLKKSRANRKRKYVSESESESDDETNEMNSILVRKLPEPPAVEAAGRVLSPNISLSHDIMRSSASSSHVPHNEGKVLLALKNFIHCNHILRN
jgi:hypothetical protein